METQKFTGAFTQKIIKTILSNKDVDSKNVKIDDINQLTKLDQSLFELHFKEAILSFKDLTYIINQKKHWFSKSSKKTILLNINGIFPPGVNAIMGPSGGGKTSLLTVLGGRRELDGVEGLILLDGKPITKNFKNESGFVTQEDVLMGTLTVRENIMFSASLRLSTKIPLHKKRELTNTMINELNLEKCADSKVGTELIRGISGGEKKRVNIAIELVTIPSVLFLDEPTSGLDAATAVSVMQLLNKLSNKGCNIVISIHQPRYEIFKMFDSLILLCNGEVVYHGFSSFALDYFSNLGFQCEIHNNPADFFLDTIERDSVNPNGHILIKSYKNSELRKRVIDTLDQIEKVAPKENKKTFLHNLQRIGTVNFPTSFCHQLNIVSRRTILNLIRNPQPLLVQSFTMIIYSFIVGTIYFHVDDTYKYGIQNRTGALFFLLMNQVFGNMSAIELFMRERPLFVHESCNNVYRISVYFLSKLFCDLVPMRFVPVLIVSIIAYWMIGFRPYAANYFTFIVTLLCLTTSASSVALFSSVSFNTISVATNYTGLFFVFMMVFGGLFVNVNSIPKNIQWLKYISIFRYAYNALLINEIKDSSFCSETPSINGTIPCAYGNDYLTTQGIPYHTKWNLWSNHLALVIIILVFWTLAYIQLRRLKKKAR